MADREPLKWSTTALRGAARLLFTDGSREPIVAEDLELASGPALRLASLTIATRLHQDPAGPAELPDWLAAALRELANRAMVASRFALGQALDLWHVLWLDEPSTSQLWLPSDVPERVLVALRRAANDSAGQARRTTLRRWLDQDLEEVAALVGKAGEVDRDLTGRLLNDSLREFHAGLEVGEFRPGNLLSGDYPARVRRLLRESGDDTSGKRAHEMVPLLEGLERKLREVEPLVSVGDADLSEFDQPLTELAATHPVIAHVLRATLGPVEFPEAELDWLAADLISFIEHEDVLLSAARRLKEAGSESPEVEAALQPLRDLEQHLVELETTVKDAPDDAVDMLALAREALEHGERATAWEAIAAFDQLVAWQGFTNEIATLQDRANALSNPSDVLRHITAAERVWTRWDSPAENVEYARKYLDDAVKALPVSTEVVPVDTGTEVSDDPAPLLAVRTLFEDGDPDAAVRALWPDRAKCPDPQARSLLFKVFREHRRYAEARALFAAVEKVKAVRAFDCHALSRVALAARDLVTAQEMHERARTMGANPLWLQVVDRELHPIEEQASPHDIANAAAQDVVSWVEAVGARNVAPSSAENLINVQVRENGPVAAAEVVMALAEATPEVVAPFLANLSAHQVGMIHEPTRRTLTARLSTQSGDAIITHAKRLADARLPDEAVELLTTAVRGTRRRDLLLLIQQLIRLLDGLDRTQDAEQVLAEHLFGRPHDLSDHGEPLQAQPQSHPWGEPNLSGEAVDQARAASQHGDPAAVDLWINLVRSDRHEGLAAAMHYCIVGGRPADALQLAAEAKVTSLPYIGIVWNLACAYMRLGRNKDAVGLFRTHAEFMAGRYQRADRDALTALFAEVGQEPPEALIHRAEADQVPSGFQFVDGTNTRDEWLAKFTRVIRRGGRHRKATTNLSAKAIRQEPLVTEVLNLMDRLLEREFLLRPPKVDRAWKAEEYLKADETRLNAADGFLAQGDLVACAYELRAAWDDQPTHEGLTADLVGLLIHLERFEEAKEIADAGGERSERHDLLAAVAYAEGDLEGCREFLLRAQELNPNEHRAFAIAQLALQQHDPVAAVDALTQEAVRHVPGHLRAVGAVAVVLSDAPTLDKEAAAGAVRVIAEHAGQTRSVTEQVTWIIDHDVPFDLVELRHPLEELELERLTTAFSGHRRELLMAFQERLKHIPPNYTTARAENHDFLVRQALALDTPYQAAQHLYDYEHEFTAGAVDWLTRWAIREHRGFEHALLAYKSRHPDLRPTMSRDEHDRFRTLRHGQELVSPPKVARELRELVNAITELTSEQIVEEGRREVELAFGTMHQALERAPERDTAVALESLWRADVAAVREVLRAGRPLKPSEYDDRAQRRANIRRLVRLADQRLEDVLQNLQDALYEPWRAVSRAKRSFAASRHRHTGAAHPDMFAGRVEEIRRLEAAFGAIAERGDWDICHVFGPSGMGKSSLARALVPHGVGDGVLPPGVVPVRITCSDRADLEQPFHWLANKAHEAYINDSRIYQELNLPEVPAPAGVRTPADFARWLGTGLPPGHGWLLLLDEFDQLPRREGQALFNGLRQLRDESGHPFGTVLFSQAPPRRLALLLGGLTMDTEKIELAGLDAEATRLMVERKVISGSRLSDDDHELIFQATGGYPKYVDKVLQSLSANGGDVGRVLDIYADPGRVELELLPYTIGSADFHDMYPTLRMLSDVLSADALAVPETDVLARLDDGTRQQESGNIRLLAEAGVLVQQAGEVAWRNTLIAAWAGTRFQPTRGVPAIRLKKTGEQLRAAGFEEVLTRGEVRATLRHGGKEYDATPVDSTATDEVDRLLRAAFADPRQYRYEGILDQQVVLERPIGQTVATVARTGEVNIERAAQWIIEAAGAVEEVYQRCGLTHGWLSQEHLRLVGGQITVSGWAESAVAFVDKKWPRWERGHVMRKAEGRAEQKDDAFALAVILTTLVRDDAREPFAQSDNDGIVNTDFVNTPDFSELDDPDGRYQKLGPLLVTLLKQPHSPKRLCEELLKWMGRDVAVAVSEIGATSTFRLTPLGDHDWRHADVPLRVEFKAESWHTTYETVLDASVWKIYQHQLRRAQVMSDHDRAQLGDYLAEALLGTDESLGQALADGRSDDRPSRVVLHAPVGLQHVPWEMSALTSSLSLAGAASVVRRLADRSEPVIDRVRPERHLVLGRPGAQVPQDMDVPSISRDWASFYRHRSAEPEPVFHFVGEGEPGRLFCDADGVDPALLGDLLYGRRTRLALLTACKSNAPGESGAGTAVQLFEAGVPAVIGMNGMVEVGSANELAVAFLKRLAATGDIELSLYHARRSVSSYFAVQDLPALFLATDNGALFTPSAG